MFNHKAQGCPRVTDTYTNVREIQLYDLLLRVLYEFLYKNSRARARDVQLYDCVSCRSYGFLYETNTNRKVETFFCRNNSSLISTRVSTLRFGCFCAQGPGETAKPQS